MVRHDFLLASGGMYEHALEGNTFSGERQHSYIKNGYIMTHPDGSKYIKKRPGYQTNTSVGQAVGWILHVPESSDSLANVVTVAYDSTAPFLNSIGQMDTQDSTVTTVVAGVASIDKVMGYSFCKTSAGADAIFIRSTGGGSTSSYMVDLSITFGAGNIHQITDGDFPNLTNAWGVVFLDGYVFVADTGGKIYNSDLNDPTSWTSTSFISMPGSDPVRVLAKHHNHVVAIGSNHTEFFYDAGNPTGSVLARRQDISYNIGAGYHAYFANFAASYGDNLFFIGAPSGEAVSAFYNTNLTPQAKPHMKQIYMLKDFQIKKISTPYIEQVLTGLNTTATGNAELGLNGIITLDNKPFLILTVDSSGNCYVYDIDEEAWYIWTLTIAGITTGNMFINAFGDTSINYFTNSSTNFQDNGSNYAFEVVTPKVDVIPDLADSLGSIKFCKSLQVRGNRPATSTNISISYSDDDFQTFSTGRNVDISKYENKATRWGKFRERAWKISYSGSSPIELDALVLDIDAGTS
jgi:hypothetical protein